MRLARPAGSTATSNQTLRATTDTELVHGPDYRVTVGPASGASYPTPYWGNTAAQNARIILSRWPVLQVTQVQTCPNSQWPRVWTTLPAGYAEPEVPPLAMYNSITPGGTAEGGQAIIVGGGYINWQLRPERVGDPGHLHQRLAPLLPHLRRRRRSHQPAR